MITYTDVLQKSKVVKDLKPWKVIGPYSIFLTKHNQIMGTYSGLNQFRQNQYDKYGKIGDIPAWEAHHILELNQFDNLRIRDKFTDEADCLCVLIPKAAHSRINSRLSTLARNFIDVNAVIEGYHDAHDTIGNYNGAGESAIKIELDAIVETSINLALV